MISSTTNERVKLARSLIHDAKARRKEGKVALEGVRLIADALAAGVVPEFVLYDPDQVNAGVLRTDPRIVWEASAEVMRAITITEHPQGIVGVFPTPALNVPMRPRRAVILDNVRDPGNAGTILRTAAAAGVQVVIFAPGSVDAYNDKVLRGAMGAHFRIALRDWDWEHITTYCKDTVMYLADMTGDMTYDAADWTDAWSLIVGGEAEGASADAISAAAKRLYIPMAQGTESLNAGIATAVMLFEAARQGRG